MDTGFFPRRLTSFLLSTSRQFPAVVLTGPRQSGKTCLLRQVFNESHAYVSLDDPDERRFAADDPRGFMEDHPPPLVIDEIQHVPDLLVHVKAAIDSDRDACGRFVIAGSQTFQLMRGISESLAGRCAVLRLLSLSLFENPGRRVPAVKTRETYARWVFEGTYPELHRRPGLDHRTWYSSYQQTYLDRDVRALANVGNLRDFERLLALLATRTGTLMNLSDLGRDLGVAANTVKAWISILEASGQIFLCPAYFDSLGKRIIKSPRLHFLDPGLACRLTRTSDPDGVLHGPLAGPLFESLIGSEVLRLMNDSGDPPALYHYRTVSGHEVDFVFEHDGRVHALECKLTSSPSPRHASGLERFLDAVPPARRGSALLVCTAPRASRIGRTRVLPVYAFSRARRLDDIL